MAYDFIHREAGRIVRSCETRDPFRIARELGIHVTYENEFTELKGMYLTIKRSRFIILNANLPQRVLKTVCSHEIGHDRFHRHLARSKALQEFMLYDMTSRPEYEANVFASDLLIDDHDILELIRDDYDIVHIAGELAVDINLVLIKVDEMRKRGYRVAAPYLPHADFLGR
jgi:Zn-dependent peptidase ImmA (M78 family)